MVGLIIHFRGGGSERRRLPAVPVPGTYIYSPGATGRLYQVEVVVVDGKDIHVYAIEVSARLTSELTATWATWGEGGCTGRPCDQAHPPERRPWAPGVLEGMESLPYPEKGRRPWAQGVLDRRDVMAR